jgi:hypothetical protein
VVKRGRRNFHRFHKACLLPPASSLPLIIFSTSLCSYIVCCWNVCIRTTLSIYLSLERVHERERRVAAAEYFFYLSDQSYLLGNAADRSWRASHLSPVARRGGSAKLLNTSVYAAVGVPNLRSNTGLFYFCHFPGRPPFPVPPLKIMSAPRRGSTTDSYLAAPNVDTPKGHSKKSAEVS